ncbi:MAG TPA: RodZ domain-containing protein [Candidatus Angelobacter sp.]
MTDIPTKREKTAMGTFGDRLRREREMRGITLDEITESTKISRRHLEALETERFDQLPGAVFNKGFVRAYAHFLGIDEDQAVADYSAASNEQPEPEDKFPLEVHDEPDPDLNPKRSYLPLAFAVAALVGVLVGYGFWVKSKQHTSEMAEATQKPAAAAVTNGGNTSSTEPAQTPAQVASDSATATPAPVQRAAATPPSSLPSTPGASEPAVKEKSFFVSIKAKEDSWVSIVADGKSVMERVLAADKHKKIKAGKTLILRTGNAGGIEVSFNGHSLGALGNENEPRTLTFNTSGLVQ